MPKDQAEAIVLRTTPLGDQDKLVVFFGKEKGVFRGVAKGVRKFGNRFGSSLEPLSLVHVFYYEKERKELVTVSACDLIESFFEMQKDLKVSFALSYFAELIEEFSRSRDEVLFRLLLSVLHGLADKGDPDYLSGYFETWLLRINGYLPGLDRCKHCRKPLPEKSWLSPKRDGAYCGECAPIKKDDIPPSLRLFLKWVAKTAPVAPEAQPFGKEDLSAIRKILQAMIVFHLEREPRTLRYVRNGF